MQTKQQCYSEKTCTVYGKGQLEINLPKTCCHVVQLKQVGKLEILNKADQMLK